MARLFDQLVQTLGDILAAPAVQLGLQVVGAYLVVIWLAAAYWAYRDMARRTGDLIIPFVSAGLVIVATPILFPAALLVHLVVRPPETAAERVDRRLREAALAAELPVDCSVCGASVAADWLACPACGTTQRHRCATCDRLVELDWNVCAWCATALVAAPELATIGAVPAPERLPVATAATRAHQPASGSPSPSGSSSLDAADGTSHPVIPVAAMRQMAADR